MARLEEVESGHVVEIVLIDDLRLRPVFGAFAWLREVAVGSLEHGVLVPVPKLAVHRGIAVLRALVLFHGSLFAVLILDVRT